MPVNGMQTGKDCQIVLTDSKQGQITVNVLTAVDFKQMVKQIESVAIDGTTRYASLPKGWGVELDTDRADSKLLDFVVKNEADYLAGKLIGTVTMTTHIANADGSKSQYRLTGGTLHLPNAGNFAGLDKTKQKASVTFARMLKV